MNKNKIDFSEGNLIYKIILFVIPVLLGELFQNLYNSIDALIVGNIVGKTSLAAVSMSEEPASLIVGFFTGVSVGVSSIVSRAVGENDKPRELLLARVCFSFSVVLVLVFTVAGILGTPAILHLMNPEEELFRETIIYLRIYLIGLVFTAVYNIGAGLLRAVGDSRSPFRILIVTSMVNIGTDYLFVGILSLRVAGAALATVAAQGISVILVYRKLKQTETNFRIDFRELLHNLEHIRPVIAIGVPAGLQNSLISISNMFVWRYVNLFSTEAVAGIGVAQRLNKFVSMPCKAIGISMTTVIGQNYGARNPKRCREGIKKGLLLSLTVTMCLSAALYLGARPLSALFNPDIEVIAVSVAMMHTLQPMFFTMSIREILLGTLRGFGIARIPMILSLTGMIGCRQLFLM